MWEGVLTNVLTIYRTVKILSSGQCLSDMSTFFISGEMAASPNQIPPVYMSASERVGVGRFYYYHAHK